MTRAERAAMRHLLASVCPSRRRLRDGLHAASVDSFAGGMRLIGLAGYAGSGKDTTGALLVKNHYYENIAIAEPLKEVALALGWNGEKDERGRVFLQELGDAVRKYNQYFLINKALSKAHRYMHDAAPCNVAITDVRYANEAEAIRKEAGSLWRLEKEGVGPANEHASESQSFPVDYIIENNGSLDDLALIVADIIKNHSLEP